MEKSLQFKKHHIYDDEYKKIKSVRKLFKQLDRDYYKPTKAFNSFDNKKNSYIKYISKGDKYENLSLKEYLDMIRPYLRDMINDHKVPINLNDNLDDESKFGEWKIQQIIQISCISSKNFKETRTIYSPIDNIEISLGSETDHIIDERFESLLQRFQDAKEKSKDRGSEFIHKSVDLLYYHLHKISLKRGKSYIESPEWFKNKRATINPKNKKDDNCFQYGITVALNNQNIGKVPQRISKIKLYINQYNWKDIDFPSHQNDNTKNAFIKDWKKFEKTIDKKTTIALNIIYVPYKSKQIRIAYKSKYNRKCENQVILLMITDGEK